MKTLIVDKHGPCVTVRLHRPEARNAFNNILINELTKTLANLEADVRVVVITGEGTIFCAGADLNQMKESVKFSEEDNRKDAHSLAQLFRAVDEAPQVVIGRVNGVAMGGGLGLVACCDMVAAVDTARFGFTEVRLGLVPAVISPYVVAKIGASQARRYFVTGELFGAHSAYSMNLVHKVVEAERLDHVVSEWSEAVLKCGPVAVREAKGLVRAIAHMPAAEAEEQAVRTIAKLRVSPEAQEGLAAFLEKRKPRWST